MSQCKDKNILKVFVPPLSLVFYWLQLAAHRYFFRPNCLHS